MTNDPSVQKELDTVLKRGNKLRDELSQFMTVCKADGSITIEDCDEMETSCADIIVVAKSAAKLCTVLQTLMALKI